MSPNHVHTGPALQLSPAALTLLRLPLQCDRALPYNLVDADGSPVGTIDHYGDNVLDAELATFIAALLNAALTPGAPAPITPEWTAAQILEREG